MKEDVRIIGTLLLWIAIRVIAIGGLGYASIGMSGRVQMVCTIALALILIITIIQVVNAFSPGGVYRGKGGYHDDSI